MINFSRYAPQITITRIFSRWFSVKCGENIRRSTMALWFILVKNIDLRMQIYNIIYIVSVFDHKLFKHTIYSVYIYKFIECIVTHNSKKVPGYLCLLSQVHFR